MRLLLINLELPQPGFVPKDREFESRVLMGRWVIFGFEGILAHGGQFEMDGIAGTGEGLPGLAPMMTLLSCQGVEKIDP